MKTIGLLSDTHNHIDDKFINFLKDCDMILHAGDIGSLQLADKLAELKPFVAVSGNIDDYNTRLMYPKEQSLKIENVKIYMTHIGGYPGKYPASLNKKFAIEKPDIFICGHSHILRVVFDSRHNFLLMNPGAAGQYGQQHKRTVLRFQISDKDIQNLEICELSR